MYADNRRVDHLDTGIMGSGKCVYDAAPDTSSPPPDEPVVASGVWAKRRRQITPGAPDRRTQKMPLRTRRSFTRRTPRGLFGSIGLMAVQS
jgi:hypothetical protein